MSLSNRSLAFRFLSVAALAFTFTSAHAQTAATPPKFPGQGPARPLPPHKEFRGRSWGDLFRTKDRNAAASGHGDAATVRRMIAHKAGSHRDGGPLGTETYSPYFSGSDTSLGFPGSFNLGAAAQRQPNCSLTELIGGLVDTGQYEVVQTIPNFDKYLHSISGLTTNGGTFPWGCADPLLTGQTYKTINLGQISNGNYAGATYSYTYDDAVYVGVFNLTSYTNVANHDYAVGYNINGLVGATFVDDSYPSIAVIDTATSAYNSPAQISILNPNGDGTYKTAIQLPADAALFGIVTGDFNGDGHVDIVASAQKSNGDYELLFFAGNGDGTFKAAVSTDTGTTERLVAQPADINGDGKLDIVAWDFNLTSQNRTYTLDTLINSGTATFTPTLSATGSNYFPVYAWDLNADGKLDLIYTDTFNNTVVVLQGDGAGHFTYKATYPTVFFPDASYVSDYDGDGVADILVGVGGLQGAGPVEQGTGEILLGNGDFTFSSPALPQPITSGVKFLYGPQAFAVADLNGDSKQDLAVLGSNAGVAAVTTYLNNYAPNLANGTTVNFNLSADTDFQGLMLAAPLGNSTSPNSLIVYGTDPSSQQPAFQAAVNSGNDKFTVNSTLLDLPAPATSAVSADFNGDSKGDLAYILDDNSEGSADALYIAHGNGDGTFKTPTILDSAINYGGRVFTADVNGDGKPDLIAVQATSGYSYVRIYLNQGSTFAAPVNFSTPDGAVISWVIAADFTGDGKLDLGLIGAPSSNPFAYSFYLYTGNKTASFTYTSTTSLSQFGSTTGVAVDVNQDGILDLVVDGCCGDTGPSVLLGKSSGVFYPAQGFVVPQSVLGLQTINLNGDKYPDLIMSASGSTNSIVPVINHYGNAPTVAKAATTINVVDPGEATQGEELDIGVTVNETKAAGQPTGTLTLSYGSDILQTLQYTGGEYYFTIADTAAFTPGSYTLTINYSGDNFNQPSTATITIKVIYATALTLNISPLAIPAGDNVTLTSTITRPYGSGYPTGNVVFFYNNGNTILANAPLVNGVAKLIASTKGYPAGIYEIEAAYFGDTLDGDSSTVNIPVTIVPAGLNGTTTAVTYSPDPATQGQNITLTATVVKASGSGTPTGNVNFYEGYENGQLIATVPLNSKGQANVTASTTNYYPGNYYITATYGGNSTTYKSTSPVTAIDLRNPSQTDLYVSPSTITPGQTVTITATVPQLTYNVPMGTVKIYANGYPIGTVKLSGGTGTITASSTGLSSGTYNVTGVYSGDSNYGASTSSAVPVTVQ